MHASLACRSRMVDFDALAARLAKLSSNTPSSAPEPTPIVADDDVQEAERLLMEMEEQGNLAAAFPSAPTSVLPTQPASGLAAAEALRAQAEDWCRVCKVNAHVWVSHASPCHARLGIIKRHVPTCSCGVAVRGLRQRAVLFQVLARNTHARVGRPEPPKAQDRAMHRQPHREGAASASTDSSGAASGTTTARAEEAAGATVPDLRFSRILLVRRLRRLAFLLSLLARYPQTLARAAPPPHREAQS